MTRLMRWWAGLALLAWAGPVGAAVVLQATSATVDQPGDVADVCVVLDSGGAEVAGTQNDLVWDGSCATLSDTSACRINPASGKQLHGGLLYQLDFTYRALVLSLSDVDPIPDGELYCCTFQVEASPGTCCSIDVTNPGASDPSGHTLPTWGNAAVACVQSDLAPLPPAAGASPVRGGSPIAGASPVPGGSPIPTPTPVPSDGDDGCQVGPGRQSVLAPLLSLGAALLLALRRRPARAR